MVKIKKILSGIIIAIACSPVWVFAICGANTNSGSFSQPSTQYLKYTTNAFGWTGGTITACEYVDPSILPDPAGDNQRGWFQLSNATTNVSLQMIYYASGGTTYEFRGTRTKHGVGNQQNSSVIGDITGTWLHICITYDGTTLRGFTAVHGGTHTEVWNIAASGNGNSGQAWDGLTVNGWTGADASTYQPPSQLEGGLIDEVRIYVGTALTAAQMDADFDTQLAGTESGLTGYYQFNNDAWADKTSGGRNLTAVNSPTFSSTVPFAGTSCASPFVKPPEIIIWN